MSKLSRRRFLQSSGAVAGAMALSGHARASVWGAGEGAEASMLLPEGRRAKRVLEIFMNGGMGPFESLYVVPEFGRANDPDHPNQQWYLWQDLKEEYFSRLCGVPRNQWLEPWKRDANGRMVNLGPVVMPLRNRPDVLGRMRMHVRQHESSIHVVAIPLAMTGRRRGDVLMASMGAHVARHFMEREGGARSVPYSYVLYPANTSIPSAGRPLTTTGLHPGGTRPLYIQVGPRSSFADHLARRTVGSDAPAFDALVEHYAARARARYGSEARAIRTPALDDFESELAHVRSAPQLRNILTPSLFSGATTDICDFEGRDDPLAPVFDAAVRLLKHPTLPARYVTVINNGLGDDIWDPHFYHLDHHARNWPHMLELLLSRINEPGEDDPDKIDLDDTMVLLTSEFGRSPMAQDGTILGTNHWPHGYVTCMIGGPIREEQAGIVGAIGPDGYATESIPVIDDRAAVLAAMGISPFEREAFGVGEVNSSATKADGLAYLHEVVLGIRS